jgi:hypothetical protein
MFLLVQLFHHHTLFRIMLILLLVTNFMEFAVLKLNIKLIDCEPFSQADIINAVFKVVNFRT